MEVNNVISELELAYKSNRRISVYIPEVDMVKTGKVGKSHKGELILITCGGVTGHGYYHLHSGCSILYDVERKKRIDSPGYLSSPVVVRKAIRNA